LVPCARLSSPHSPYIKLFILSYLSVCLYANPSICPSATWVDQSQTVEIRNMQFSLYNSPIPIVFVGKVSFSNYSGFPGLGIPPVGVQSTHKIK